MADEVRTAQHGAVAWISDERVRVAQHGLVVWLGGDNAPVQVAQHGSLVWIGQLGRPRVSGVADQHQNTLTITPGLGATNHKLYRGTECDGDFPLDGDHLVDDALGATPSPYVDSGLVEATDYWYIVVAEDPSFGLERASDVTLVHTLDYGTAPDLRLASLAATEATFEIIDADGPEVLRIVWELYLASDTCFDSPILTRTDASPSTRRRWDLSGLATDVDYVVRARRVVNTDLL